MVRDIDDWYESYRAMVDGAMNKYFFLHIIYYMSPSAKKLLDWCWGMSKSTIVSSKAKVLSCVYLSILC